MGFENKAIFPHSLGAVDRKHIRIRKSSFNGSMYFSYKKSIVLLEIVNWDYCFVYVSVGSYNVL